ncbi:hypothetical protein BMETH_607_2 [methanotrophic bacterial endosymbiont of Bathymodiolus sp.]|nr:hypothetical protein BMETH_607_2 [methanotrophic bacterial endosymbiont of Bathymodiolus sp.]
MTWVMGGYSVIYVRGSVNYMQASEAYALSARISSSK